MNNRNTARDTSILSVTFGVASGGIAFIGGIVLGALSLPGLLPLFGFPPSLDIIDGVLGGERLHWIAYLASAWVLIIALVCGRCAYRETVERTRRWSIVGSLGPSHVRDETSEVSEKQ